jgi:hypothetical protein
MPKPKNRIHMQPEKNHGYLTDFGQIFFKMMRPHNPLLWH